MKTFSSIYPFTNRLELRRATCISGGSAIGGGTVIARCPVWDMCNLCDRARTAASHENLVVVNCPRCGGEFEIQRIEIGAKLSIDFNFEARAFISGEIAQRNLHRTVDPRLPFYRLGIKELERARFPEHALPPISERMDLVLWGIVYLSEQNPSKCHPSINWDDKAWAFLMACAYSSRNFSKRDVECIVQKLAEKGFVCLPSGSVDSVKITEKGRKHYELLVEVMRGENPEKQDG